MKYFVYFVEKQLSCSLYLPSAEKETFASLCLCVQKNKKHKNSVPPCLCVENKNK